MSLYYCCKDSSFPKAQAINCGNGRFSCNIALNHEAEIGSVVEAGVAFYKTFGGYEGGDILWVVG